LPTAGRPSRQSGFTLIEVVVALAIAALALVAIFEAGGAGLRGVDLAQRYVAATRAAQAHLAEVGVSIPLATTETGGVDAAGFRWAIRMTPTLVRPAADDRNPPQVLYAVDSSVSWQAGAAARSVHLSTLRLGTANARRP
jgi:general secretion pathway protein I